MHNCLYVWMHVVESGDERAYLRKVILFDFGRKLVSVCNPLTGTVARLPQSELAYTVVADVNWRKIARLLRSTIWRKQRYGDFVSKIAFRLMQRLIKDTRQLKGED